MSAEAAVVSAPHSEDSLNESIAAPRVLKRIQPLRFTTKGRPPLVSRREIAVQPLLKNRLKIQIRPAQRTRSLFVIVSVIVHCMGLLLLAVFCVAQADSAPIPIVTVTDWEFQRGNFYEAPLVSEETGSNVEALNNSSPVDTLESFVPPTEIPREPKVESVALADSIELISHPISTEPLPETFSSNSFMNFGVGESGEFRQPRSHQKGTSNGIENLSIGVPTNTEGGASTNTAANQTIAPRATGEGVAVTHSLGVAAIPRTIGIGTYPKRAIREHREGLVKLRVEVLLSGYVGQVELYESSGHSDLDETAVKAAKHWIFHPALSDGSPITTWLIVPVRYRLKNAPY